MRSPDPASPVNANLLRPHRDAEIACRVTASRLRSLRDRQVEPAHAADLDLEVPASLGPALAVRQYRVPISAKSWEPRSKLRRKA